MPPIVTSAEIGRPAAEVSLSPPTRPGSASGRRAWWTGTWTPRATAPRHQPWRKMRDDPAHRRHQPPVHVRARAHRPSEDWGVRGTDGPVRANVEVRVEPVTGSRSRLTMVNFTGHGIGKILVPLMVRREARKEMPGNMAALKQKMEASLKRQHLL